MRIQHSRTDFDARGGDRWYWGRRWKRLQVSVTVYRHCYYRSPDRWVIQPSIVYDRKRQE